MPSRYGYERGTPFMVWESIDGNRLDPDGTIRIAEMYGDSRHVEVPILVFKAMLEDWAPHLADAPMADVLG